VNRPTASNLNFIGGGSAHLAKVPNGTDGRSCLQRLHGAG
jgi:hypothetical protein